MASPATPLSVKMADKERALSSLLGNECCLPVDKLMISACGSGVLIAPSAA